MSNIVVMMRKYDDDQALDDVVDYCYRRCLRWHGYGVCCGTIEDAKESMQYIKKYYDQMDGRRLIHIVVNVDSSKDTGYDTKAKDWGELNGIVGELSYLLFLNGYQNCYFMHDNGKCPHAHFVVNSVNCKSGNKLRDPMEYAKDMLNYLKGKYPHLKWERVYYNKVTNDLLGYQRKEGV